MKRSTSNTEEIALVVDWILSAQKVVVLTGAGVSKESGVPTFREAQTGLWQKYDPHELATPEGFLKDPNLVWSWYDWRRKLVMDVDPNPGHYALAELERCLPPTTKFSLITQNVDDLHRRAGTKAPIHMHGSILIFKCFDRGHPQKEVPFGLKQPPKCQCGSLVRPDVVWFGEALDEQVLNNSFANADSCDLMFVVGTSGLVQPAASLPYAVKQRRKRVVEVNPDTTPITEIADVTLQGPSGDVLPKLVEQLKKRLAG